MLRLDLIVEKISTRENGCSKFSRNHYLNETLILEFPTYDAKMEGALRCLFFFLFLYLQKYKCPRNKIWDEERYMLEGPKNNFFLRVTRVQAPARAKF